MTQQTINLGTTANDGTGDPLRTAFTKINANFNDLYSQISGLELDAVIPAQSGNNGRYLSTNGSSLIWSAIANTNQLSNGSYNLLLNGSGYLVFPDGSQSAGAATSIRLGLVVPDGTTTTVSSGIISANITGLLPTQTGNNGKYLTTNGSGILSWSTVNATTNSLVNGSYTLELGSDGTLNLPLATNGQGVIQTTGSYYLDANGAVYGLGSNGTLSLPGNIVLPQSNLGVPNINGTTDAIRLYDFGHEGTQYNYAIGSEGSHIWFNVDQGNNDTMGFKFYGAGTLAAKITTAGNLYLNGSLKLSNGGSVFDNSTSTNIVSPGNLYTVTAISAAWVAGITASPYIFSDESSGLNFTATTNDTDQTITVVVNNGGSFPNNILPYIAIPYSKLGIGGSGVVLFNLTYETISGSPTYSFGVDENGNVINLPGGAYISVYRNPTTVSTSLSLSSLGAVSLNYGGGYAQGDSTGFHIEVLGNSNAYNWSFNTDGSLTLAGSIITSGDQFIVDQYAHTNPGDGVVSIGQYAGQTSQGAFSVAIGGTAGQTNQGANSVAIGNSAGADGQGTGAVGIGIEAGFTEQGNYAVAIGSGAGETIQGANAIAIGYGAGNSQQPANTIILNATGSNLNGVGSQTNSFYVAPIRTDATPSNILYYNTTTNEVTYGAVASPSSLVNGTYTLSLSANGDLLVPTSQYGTAQVFAASSNTALFLGNSSHYIQVRGNDGALVFADSSVQTTAWNVVNTTVGSSQVLTTTDTMVRDFLTVRIQYAGNSNINVQLNYNNPSSNATIIANVLSNAGGSVGSNKPYGTGGTQAANNTTWTNVTNSGLLAAQGDYVEVVLMDNSNYRIYRIIAIVRDLGYSAGACSAMCTIERLK